MLEGDGHAYALDHVDGFTSIYLSPNSTSWIYSICTAFYMPIIPQ